MKKFIGLAATVVVSSVLFMGAVRLVGGTPESAIGTGMMVFLFTGLLACIVAPLLED